MGGTIANVTGKYEGPEDFLSINELIDKVPENIKSLAEITTTEITHVSSGTLDPDDWFRVYREIMTKAKEDDSIDGFVITHGSNTAEETAFFLDLVIGLDQPIVVTFSQRHLGGLGYDGFRNLFDAIRVAAHPVAKGRGTMLVANQEIHHPRDATKIVSSRPDALRSPNIGRVGDIVDDEIRFHHHAPDKTRRIDIGGLQANDFPIMKIQIVYSAFATDGTMVRKTMDEVAGYVVAGLPTNSVPSPKKGSQQKRALEEASEQGLPIVLCNRSIEGYRVTKPFITARDLRPQHARILLALGMSRTSSFERLQAMFDNQTQGLSTES